ncbi:DUF115 domain-containing protein [Verrucomicrobiaceae bacterium R5-34]|nr:DUF115 domain-containing protein [Verrucomicrobiaceae bacterium R5-34]
MREISPQTTFKYRPDGSCSLVHGDQKLETQSLVSWRQRIQEKVVIVASGPSAKDFAWDALDRSSCTVVGVNGSPSFLADRGIQPDLWVVIDPDFTRHCSHHFEHNPKIPLATTPMSVSHLLRHHPAAIVQRPLALVERVNQWNGLPSLAWRQLLELNRVSGRPFLFPADSAGKSQIGWSHRPEYGLFSGCNVVFAALQICIGLGAKELEIVGMDLGGMGRAYDEGDAPQPTTLALELENKIKPALAMMQVALTGSGVRVTNRSPVCPLPAELGDLTD